jgi:SM-20-related protein
MSNDIQVLDNFLPSETYERLASFTSKEPMEYGARSNSRTDPHGHWSRKFISGDRHNLAGLDDMLGANPNLAPLNTAWNFLREIRFNECLLLRCYLNGYTYGTEGYFHSDSSRADEHTTIIYMNDYWEPDWAGETVFLDADGDISKSVLPRRNRAIIFPSNIEHAGRSVSRKCVSLRKALVFKVRKKRSPNFEYLSIFLRQKGALLHSHKKGTLHDHLIRTFALLEARGFNNDLCFGGGLHAVYGTNAFGHRLLTSSAKRSLIDAFGAHAEQLAEFFSRLDRPTTLEAPLHLEQDSAIVRLRDGQSLKLNRSIFDDLRIIECANLEDQNALRRYRILNDFWTTRPGR